MRPNWDDYFMMIAEVVALRSPDSETQVGAILVDESRHIIGTGYNGHPPGVDGLPTVRPDKYEFMIHAEQNVIAHCTTSPKGATLYCTHFPCENCAKLLIAAGIRQVIFRDLTFQQAVHALFQLSGVSLGQLKSVQPQGVSETSHKLSDCLSEWRNCGPNT